MQGRVGRSGKAGGTQGPLLSAGVATAAGPSVMPSHSHRQTPLTPARYFWFLLPVDHHRVLPKDTVLGEAP